MLAALAPAEPKDGLTDPDDVPEPPDEAVDQARRPLAPRRPSPPLRRRRQRRRPRPAPRRGDGRPPPHRPALQREGRAAQQQRHRRRHGRELRRSLPGGARVVSSRKRGTKALDAQGLHHSGFDVARGKSGIRHHQKLDLERHPEKAQATHRKLRAKDRPLVNDFISDEAFEALLCRPGSRTPPGSCVPAAPFYVWGGYANLANYPPALKAAGLYFSQAIIWDKEHPVLTRKDLMGAHEWSLLRLEGRGRPPLLRAAQRHRPLARQEGQPERDGPPHREAGRAGAPGHRVQLAPGRGGPRPLRGLGLDARRREQTGRRAYLMEIDPLYCDVVVARFEAFSGKKAERVPAPAEAVA